ncbi:hypothetical protein NPS54_26390 [Pseudomonas putida]|nr:MULTISPECIES: hypothetical protein [Pseudomonas]KMU94583.1 hypothetical protein AC138_18020 [Pseudomonas putida]KMY31215.1 hypothetical protein AA993_20340 [Pseudomonas putida]MDD2082657.1 hypothetical protein [Pseudomonas putida]PXZ45838.1 hypothetical protein DM483_27160 [Pseudomonas sp. SMT-1]QDW57183.1 hypothetical protein FFH79_010025 [Pseudomonas sp. KBS0802]
MNDMDVKDENDPFASDSTFLKGAAPKVTVHTAPMLKVDFAPWHKPRKQWIRDQQWGVLIKGIINNLELAKQKRSLNYLSLPGVDLLDVRALEEVCTETNVKVKFLGLNYIDSNSHEELAEQALSLNEVRSLEYVDQESTLITERFESLCDNASIASQQVLAPHKSFDVVNIDLCASFARYKPGTWNSLYTAIHRLFVHQTFCRTEPWLFFITTRTNKEKVDADAFLQLMKSVGEAVSPDLLIEFMTGRMGVDSALVHPMKLSQETLTSLQHMNCFTASFGIWKLRILLSGDYKSESHMHKPFMYHVESKDAVPDMASMSFWCSRLPPAGIDPTGLSSVGNGTVNNRVEKAFAKQARRAFVSTMDGVNLDTYLAENNDDYQLALARSKELLRRARYSLETYDDWVAEQQAKIDTMRIAQ